MQRDRIFLSDTIDVCVERAKQIRLRCWNRSRNGGCHHQVIVDASYLADLCTKHGWPRCLIEIGQHMPCSKCGTRWPHVEVVQ